MSLIKPPTLSDASRIVSKVDQAELQKHFQMGKLDGMNTMHGLILNACSRVKGIGPKRQQAIRNSILDLIIEIGKESGVITDADESL